MLRPLLVPAVAGTAAALVLSTPAEAKVVVHGTYKALSGKTITYEASNGTYRATWIGVRHYRVRGTINGRRLRGSFRTHQNASGTRFIVRGSGRYGARKVRIRGGGPNNLRTTTLVLR